MAGIVNFTDLDFEDENTAGWVCGFGDADADGITTKVAFRIERLSTAAGEDVSQEQAKTVLDNLRNTGWARVAFQTAVPHKFALDRLYLFDKCSARPFYLPGFVAPFGAIAKGVG